MICMQIQSVENMVRWGCLTSGHYVLCMCFKCVGRVCYYRVMCLYVGVVVGSGGPSVPQQPEKYRRIT